MDYDLGKKVEGEESSRRRQPMNLGEQVKKLRKHLGLTQREFARGIPGQPDLTYIGKIERGDQDPSLKLLRRIATGYGVPLGYFFLEESQPQAEAMDAYLNVSLTVKEEVRRWLLKRLPAFEEELRKKIEASTEKALQLSEKRG